jgi:hypothetical protein
LHDCLGLHDPDFLVYSALQLSKRIYRYAPLVQAAAGLFTTPSRRCNGSLVLDNHCSHPQAVLVLLAHGHLDIKVLMPGPFSGAGVLNA